jgi:uroporphyrinogen-III synthase
VVVTRGVDKIDRLPSLLEGAGAVVVKVPLIAPVPLVGDAEIRAALARLRRGGASTSRWVVVTSETAVALVTTAASSADLAGVSVAAVGTATAAALRARGMEPALVAPGQEAESLAAELSRLGVDGASALVIAAAGGRNVVAPALAAGGALVDVLEAYRTVMPEGAADTLRAVFDGPAVDAITFTSGSTVRHCATALAQPPSGCAAVCIGEVTAQAAREAGWSTVLTAAEHSAEGIAVVMVEHLGAAHPLP